MHTHRSIRTLQPGEHGFIPQHAAWISGSDMYVNGNFPLREIGGGSLSIRLVKNASGRLLVDLTGCDGPISHGNAGMSAPIDPIKIDEALEPLYPDPAGRRIFDLRSGESGYIPSSAVWVHNDMRMWLNGYTRISKEVTAEAPLKVTKRSDGAFVVDLSYCHGVEWPTQEPTDQRVFPIQVYRRVG